MRVLLDDKPIAVDRPTLAAALAAVRIAAERANRVVIEATIDGVAIDGDELENPPTDERAGSEVRFVSADPATLVRGTMLDVAATLDGAKADQASAADLIQVGKIDEAMKPFPRPSLRGTTCGRW